MTDEELSGPLTETHVFKIRSSQVSDIQKELEKKKKHLLSRIQKLIEKTTFNDTPILGQVINCTRDAEELMLLSKVIGRVAQIVPEYEKLEQRLHMIKSLEDDRDWFTSNFGDLAPHVDQLITDISKENSL